MIRFILFLTVSYAATPEGMVFVPECEFTMGRTKLTPDDKTIMRPRILLDDRPARKVFVSAFHIDVKEVTHEQYAVFVAATKRAAPYHWVDGKPPADLLTAPAFNVTWNDAVDYCKWQGKRLPTEAEWEKAARGGKEGLDYPLSNKIDATSARYANTAGPLPVGKFPPNDYGLHDMIGNVAEWCSDWFDEKYYENSPIENPRGPTAGSLHVARGGGFNYPPLDLRCAFRVTVETTYRNRSYGFRVVRER